MNFLNILMTILPDTTEPGQIEETINNIFQSGSELGWSILKALIVFSIGKILISLLNKLIQRILTKRKIEPSVKTFLASLVNITLTILLIISVVGALGVETTSFAALLASAGVAIGVAMSGNLSNFVGGIVILLFKPFKVGDYIEAQGIGGTVQEIQIFHTVLNTSDNKQVFAPNGALSSGIITNYNNLPTRRVEWIIGISYGQDYPVVQGIIDGIIRQDTRILLSPEPLIAVHGMTDIGVNIVLRAWVKRDDYWSVYFDVNEKIYAAFSREGIKFPIPKAVVRDSRV